MGIPVFCSYIRRKDMDAVLNCLVTDSVGPGAYLDRFQKYGREALGYEYGFALRSPFLALDAALDALGVEAGAVIALPALGPAYYAAVLAARGCEALYYDVVKDSVAADPVSIREGIAVATKKPALLVLSHALGVMADPVAVCELGIPVIEDCSEAMGAHRDLVPAGAVGQLALFGLEHGAVVTAGGGALLTTRGKREAAVLRNLAESRPPELVMTDYNAALAWAQLRDLASTIEKRRELYGAFSQSLAHTRHRLLSQEGEGECGYWAFPVALASGMKDVQAYARKKDVDTVAAFEDSLLGTGLVPEGCCPNARSLALRALLFPLHQRVGASGAQKIAKVLATLP